MLLINNIVYFFCDSLVEDSYYLDQKTTIAQVSDTVHFFDFITYYVLVRII